MPRDRQSRRALLLATGIVCSTISTGCLTSAFNRRAADPQAEPSSPGKVLPGDRIDVQKTPSGARTDSSVRSASVQAADGSLTGATLATPFLITPGASTAPAGAFPFELQTAPGESEGRSAPGGAGVQAPAAPAAESAPPASTPLLDAAIQRVADVTRQQREAIASSPDATEDQTRKRVSPPPAASPSAAPKTQPPDDLTQNKEVVSKQKRADITPQVTAFDAERAGDLPSAIVAQVAVPEHRAPLVISELRLCRKVFGFGSFEPLAEPRVKVGQHLLVYCELTGLQYETRDEGFVSRIASRVEVRPAEGVAILWEQELGAAADLCRRQRRDYYVNYRVDLPITLGPGSYRLRFLQTDLIAGSATSTEIPLEISP